MGVIAANSTDREARQVSFLIGVRSTLIWWTGGVQVNE